MDAGGLRSALIAARARTSPDSVAGTRGRRRVPGLRREEVAELVGMTAEWYARCESGKARFSIAALTRVCEVLRIEGTDRMRIFALSRPELRHASDAHGTLSGTELLAHLRRAAKRIAAAGSTPEIGQAVATFLLDTAQRAVQVFVQRVHPSHAVFECVEGLWQEQLREYRQEATCAAHIWDRILAGLPVGESDLSISPSEELRERHARFGVSSYAAVPVNLEVGTPWLILGFASPNPGRPAPLELEALNTIAAMVEAVHR